MYVNIAGLDKADVLLALYNAGSIVPVEERAKKDSKSIQVMDSMKIPLTLNEAREVLSSNLELDYLNAIAIKIDFKADDLYVYAYNKNHGENKAQDVILALREEKLKEVLLSIRLSEHAVRCVQNNTQNDLPRFFVGKTKEKILEDQKHMVKKMYILCGPLPPERRAAVIARAEQEAKVAIEISSIAGLERAVEKILLKK